VLGVDALTERVVLASVQDDFVDRDAVDVRALLALNRVRSGTNASMTNTPAASGRATRPVPIASSIAGPSPANSASSSTVTAVLSFCGCHWS